MKCGIRQASSLATALAVATLLTACGTSTQSSGTTSTSASGANSLVAAKAQVAQFSANPAFTAPGPAIDAKKTAGMTVFNIPESSSNAFLQGVDAGAQAAAKAAGMKWTEYQNSGTPNEWVSGIQQAISQHANVILLNSILGSAVQPALLAAKAAHIPVVIEHLYDKSYALPPNVSAFEYGPFNQAAQLEAQYTAVNSNGRANVLIVQSNDFPPSVPQTNVITSELHQLCPSGCKITTVNVPSTEWATKLQSTVQTQLTSNPGIDYVIPLYDSMTEFLLPGIEAAGKATSVKIVTYNGTPSILKYISQQNVVVADVGENPAAIGYSAMDQVFRVALNLPVNAGNTNPIKIFDASNIAEAGTPPALGQGYGNAYEAGFLKLWGLS